MCCEGCSALGLNKAPVRVLYIQKTWGCRFGVSKLGAQTVRAFLFGLGV